MFIQGCFHPLWAEKISAQVDTLPYSSSYLSVLASKLTGGFFAGRPWGIKDEYYDWYDLRRPDSDILLFKSQHTPLIERFDQATFELYGAKPIGDLAEEEFSAPFYEIFWKTPLWVGYCHRRTAASSDKLINALARNQYGLLCGDVVISQGEIKELFTALTPYDQPSYRGQVSNNTPPPHDLRTASGLDDLSPLDFHKSLYLRLSNNQFIGLERNSGLKVDNRTIFAAESDIEDVSLSDLKGRRSAPVVPLKYLIPRSSKAKEDLSLLLQMQNLARIEAANWRIHIQAYNRWDKWLHRPGRNPKIYKKANEDYFYSYEQNGKTIVVSRKKIVEELEKTLNQELEAHNQKKEKFFVKNEDWLRKTARRFIRRFKPQGHKTGGQKPFHKILERYKARDLGFFYSVIAPQILPPLIREGQVRLSPRIRLKKIKTKIWYRADTAFNTPEIDSQNIDDSEYSYLFAYSKNKVVFSSWLTRSKKRPDIVWWTAPIDIEEYKEMAQISREFDVHRSTSSYTAAFDNLLRLLEDCQPLEQFLRPGHPPELAP